MKAAVVFQLGELPRYVDDFAEPIVKDENKLLIYVKACAVKNLDKMQASGKHYSVKGKEWTPKVIGGDGVGILEDGTGVYGIGISGMLAEKALVEKDKIVVLPKDLDYAIAAAIPNAVMGSVLALKYRAGLQEGETVLINGATGVTGRVAVQLAKYYGAKKVIVTGRNEQSLQDLLSLGADEIISLKQDKEAFIKEIKEKHTENSIDVIIDYLWGESVESILLALKGNGRFTPRTRLVTVGTMMGDTISLSASILRGTDIQISGSGIGSWTKEEVVILIKEILPEMFALAAKGDLKINVQRTKLSDIEKVWDLEVKSGSRLVVEI